MSGTLSAGAGARSAGSSASASFMNVPPTQSYGSVSDGYVREGHVAAVSAATRNRYKPIFMPGQSRHVGGPNNSGDSSTSQDAQGSGSFSTSKPAS